MAVEGVIAERTRGILPVTWDALSKDARFGDDLLQVAVDTAKENVLGLVPAVNAEPAYPLIVRDYVAKVAALEIIPAGIDFWMNEPLSESATGTDETHTFTERAETLRKLGEALLDETRRLADEIAELIGFRRSTGKSRALSSTTDDAFLTPDPVREFPRPFRETTFS